MKKVVITITTIIYLLLLSTSLVEAEETTLKSPMPTPRMASAFASVDEKIYIIGGMTKEGKTTSIMEEYSPSTDKWTKKPSMPTPRGCAAAVAVGKMIYVIGGRNESGVTNVVEVYDTVLNSWKKVKSMSQPRWNHMVAEIGGKIYVIGGITGVGDQRKVIDTVEIYDPQKDLWSTGHPMPAPRQAAAVAVVHGKIYIIGGRVGAGDVGYATDSVEIYDPLKNNWSSAKQKMQEARTGAQAVVVDGKIYVIGGAAGGETIKSIEVYDPATDVWTTSKFSLQKPRTGHSVALVGGKIYIIGGATEISPLGIIGTVEELTIKAKNRSKK
jgi:N-acetylneuraminic acid mutarotase